MKLVQMKYPILFVLLLLLFQGCATFTSHQISSRMKRPPQCEEFYSQLNDAVGTAGVRDASSFPVGGFPYLRTNRFLAALESRAGSNTEIEQWVHLMRELALQAKAKEISNLPDLEIGSLKSGAETPSDRKELLAHVESCSSLLVEHDELQGPFRDTLHRSIHVPEEYSLVLRTVGIYPLTSIPINIVSERVRRKFKGWYDTEMKELAVQGRLETFVPPEGTALSPEDVRDLLNASVRNPLRIPLLEKKEAEQMARTFSPVFIQDVAAPYDIPGLFTRSAGSLTVDTARPAVYYYLTHALLHGQPILQINYVAWYTERAGKNSPLLERGRFDGLTARISLDADGEVFMVDMMNNCGCYHFFVPRGDRVEQIKPKLATSDPFVPQWLPEVQPGERLAIRINSGWHQVERLFAAQVSHKSIHYELVPYDVLEQLPDGNGRSESIFDSHGILKGSGRIEQLILFSAGIPSIGAMRQRGHHAIEITGHAHFDEPNLFEEYFVFK
jgi:hypothetical protein